MDNRHIAKDIIANTVNELRAQSSRSRRHVLSSRRALFHRGTDRAVSLDLSSIMPQSASEEVLAILRKVLTSFLTYINSHSYSYQQRRR